jgi:exodeoxyribonuclease VII small subunit
VTSKKAKSVDFEQALEHGELPLDEALKQFERGIELARGCQDALKQAEQRVEILLKKNPDAEPEPFDAADE